MSQWNFIEGETSSGLRGLRVVLIMYFPFKRSIWYFIYLYQTWEILISIFVILLDKFSQYGIFIQEMFVLSKNGSVDLLCFIVFKILLVS